MSKYTLSELEANALGMKEQEAELYGQIKSVWSEKGYVLTHEQVELLCAMAKGESVDIETLVKAGFRDLVGNDVFEGMLHSGLSEEELEAFKLLWSNFRKKAK